MPFDPARYAAYLGVMAAFAVSPGPANLFAIAAGMRGGARAALLAVAGMNAASLVWIGAAALGLAALAQAFPAQFRLLAIAGGLYVAWLGLRSLWAAWRGEGEAHSAVAPAMAFREGFAVQLSNPKALLFFGVVMPAFVDPTRPAGPQLAWYGATTLVMDIVVMSAYALAGGALAALLQRPGPRRVFGFAVGVLLIAAAVLILARH